ncbi:Sulfonamide resistance protein [Legionella massiliensis]|uniref:Sulfonamide resistance protein n=1 Tax=Legionella massiliensis TaxID=1034943 RepID=A0A078L5B3_9GAMM|nr:multidrug effflux MFS transporter [Legionella massiliensis]CDZ79279.1 Sulfonamide resistance protein [Legionella massiliensis]CEE15017.1 Bicyclomycin resistance protein [Legionella massiliensis]
MLNKATPFWFLGLLSAFSLLTFDLYQPALPAITQYFNTTHALGQLTLSLFFLVFGMSQLIWGPWIDHFGRRTSLAVSLIIYVFATLGCIFATNIQMLIVARVTQGFAVCCSNVVAFSSSRDYEDSTERARVISNISMIVSVSPIFAPLIGSLIFTNYDWQATFLLMIVIAILLFFASKYKLSESPFWQKSDEGFLLRTSLDNYKKILGHGRLWLGILIVTSSYSCIMLVIVNAAYLVIEKLKYSPFMFSIIFACNGCMLIVGNYLGIKLRDKRSLGWNIHFGSLLMLFGSLLMLILFFLKGLGTLSLAPILLISLGVSITNPPTFSIALADYEHQAATATAIINTVRMTVAAIIAGGIGVIIVYDLNLLAISLLTCSLICWFASMFITEGAKVVEEHRVGV